eukprot:COSAG02_NODE_21204_length_798_cov_0.928469_1_plen_232_part_01
MLVYKSTLSVAMSKRPRSSDAPSAKRQKIPKGYHRMPDGTVMRDVVYRLGRVPKPVDIKTTIGTMPRRQRGRGRGRRSQYGGVLGLTDVVMQDLRSYAKQEKLDVPIGTKAALVAGLTELGVGLSDLEGTLGRAPKVSQQAQRREGLTVEESRTSSGTSPPPIPPRTTTQEFNVTRKDLKKQLDVAGDDTTNPPEPQIVAADSDPSEVRAETGATVETGSEPVPPTRTGSLK